MPVTVLLRLFLLLNILLAGSVARALINGHVSGVEMQGARVERPLIQLGSVGGEVSFEVMVQSESEPQGPVFVTVLQARGGINMPVVTRQAPAEPAGRNRYTATFDLSLPATAEPSKYRLEFWSTAALDGQTLNLSLGQGELTVYPDTYFEFLRRLSLQHPFVLDQTSPPDGLDTFLNSRGIGFTRADRSELSSLASGSLFFTARAVPQTSGVFVALIGGEQPLSLIKQRPNGGLLVLPGERWEALGTNAALQSELARSVEALLED
ncbi:MAG: hypothetical protein ACFB21_01940 [Opitutales bacterium]